MCQESCKACMHTVKHEKAENLCRRLCLSAAIHRTHCSCRNPCRTQKALASCQHQSSLPQQGRDSQFLQHQWVSITSGRMELPSQPQPHGAPLQTQSPVQPTWGERGQHAAPAPGVGTGCQEAIHGSPCLIAPKPLGRSHCLQQDAAARKKWGEARRQCKAGPSKTSSQDQEHGHAVLGGLFLWSKLAALEDQGGKDWEWQRRASDLQSLLQPLLFPESKRQIVKGRVRTRLPHCNVHKKQGGAQCATPEPSAGPCPQQDECCGAASVCCSFSQVRHTGALDMHPGVIAGISHPPPGRDAVMRSALVRDMTDRATEAESTQKPNTDSFSTCTQCTWHEGQWEEGEDQDDAGFSLITF